jgi:16S rRNA (guanine1207-N2)-methyltransferase
MSSRKGKRGQELEPDEGKEGVSRSSHYFSKEPSRAGKKYILRLEIGGQRIELASCGGLFSKDKVDNGTLLLLKSLVLPPKGSVLDMGCGCGVVGITIAMMRPQLGVTMVDVNPLAVKYARDNLESNGVANAEALESDLYSSLDGRNFETIVSNPPLAAGYKVIFPLIEGAKSHLKEGGSLQLVLRKGVNAIPRKMEEVFGNVELISRGSGYKVFRSVKAPMDGKPDKQKA